MSKAWANAMSGSMASAKHYVKAAETALLGFETATINSGHINALKAFISLTMDEDFEAAHQFSDSALDAIIFILYLSLLFPSCVIFCILA